MQYKKKPAIVLACQFLGYKGEKPEFANMDSELLHHIHKGVEVGENEIGAVWRVGKNMHVMNLSGVGVVEPGDWIIWEDQTFKPCARNLFHKIFEPHFS